MAEDMEIVEKLNGDNLQVNGDENGERSNAVNSSKDTDSGVLTDGYKMENQEPLDTSDSSIQFGLEDSPGKDKRADESRGASTLIERKETDKDAVAAIKEGSKSPRGIKRKASSTLSDADDTEEESLKGFETPVDDGSADRYSRLVDKYQSELRETEAEITSNRPSRAKKPPVKRARTGTPTDNYSSRPSSGLSLRSENELVGGNSSSTEVTSSAASSPAARRAARAETSHAAYRVPLDRGWKRELVYRATLEHGAGARRNADVYYYTPSAKKLRSNREVAEHIAGSNLTLDNFTFFKEPLGVDDPEKEIIRDAKIVRRVESPSPHVSTPTVAATTPGREGKRTPKPKPPKGASPERAASTASPKTGGGKLKVKSVGSRLSLSTGLPSVATPPKPVKTPRKSLLATPTNNNTTTGWKKPSVEDSPSVKRRGRAPLANGSPSARRRGRPARTDEQPGGVDHFAQFYKTSQERGYNSVVQIFQYLKMRELAAAARVCRLWRDLAATPALWRHVRMKNSQVSDWRGLCAALKAHGTRRLDLRKMLLPASDTNFWLQFSEHIATVDTLERIDLCRCPAAAVERLCVSHPRLLALGALAVRCDRLDPAPLAALTQLEELRIKSMAGLTLTSDLKPLANLTNLKHLSLTSIKELGSAACGVVGSLRALESLELGECTFGPDFGTTVLARLQRLQRLRLERGTAECGAPRLLSALAGLPALRHLELVNFDVKAGFDDALAECTNIKRLLIIPTYVSQSATTNRQVLSGVLRLKDTLTHLMWGVTIELLRVTELFIDQCDQGGEKKKANIGECIPVLKPVPGLSAVTLEEGKDSAVEKPVNGPPQVEILPLPSLQRLLNTSLPHTKLKVLRIPFHATWRQSLADFQ